MGMTKSEEDQLLTWCKNLVAHDMGLKDADLLDEDFYFIGPFDGPLGKTPFIEGSKSFDLRGAFPDFDFNAHHFRVDEVEMESQQRTKTSGPSIYTPSPTKTVSKESGGHEDAITKAAGIDASNRRVGRVWFSTKKTGTHLGKLPMYGEVSLFPFYF